MRELILHPTLPHTRMCHFGHRLLDPKGMTKQAVVFNGIAPVPSDFAVRKENEGKKRAEDQGFEEIVFLCLGIVCPRKNQLWLTKVFQRFARERRKARAATAAAGTKPPPEDCKFVIVGARFVIFVQEVRNASTWISSLLHAHA